MSVSMEHPEPILGRPHPYLHSHAGTVVLTLPTSWQLSTLADFPKNTVIPDASALTTTALANPHDSRSLPELLQPSDTVCILIEDLTRTSPKQLILEVVLRVLENIGIPPERITILIALGTHQPLSHRQLRHTFGEGVVDRYRFVNHDCHADNLQTIGNLASGTPVRINKIASDADFRLGIGSIFPHPLNGFGGGGKILFPGIADATSIFEHHLHYAFRGSSALGSLAGNAFRDEIERLAKAGRLDFIINSVLDNTDRLHQVVAGSPSAAHLAGTTLCRAITSRRFTERTEVTIISAFPYDQGPQIMKPLAPASMITRLGGTIILAASCRTPLPEMYFAACEDFRKKHGRDLRRAVFDHFRENRPILPQAPPELNMSMAQTMLAQNDFQVILATSDIPGEQIARLGFIPATNLEQAIALANQMHHGPSVNIVPSGGVILPIVEAT